MWLVGVNLPFVLHRATTNQKHGTLHTHRSYASRGELAISSNPEHRKSETGSRYQAQPLSTFSALYCVVLCCTVLLIPYGTAEPIWWGTPQPEHLDIQKNRLVMR